VSYGNDATGLSLVTDGEPRVDGYDVGWDGYLLYRCPWCCDLHADQEGRVLDAGCTGLTLAVVGGEQEGAFHLVNAGTLDRTQRIAWELRVEREFHKLLARHLRIRSAVLEGSGCGRFSRGVTPQQRARILERDEFKCRRCGSQAPEVRLEVDHVVPVALGGATTPENLQSLCESCNAGKSSAFPHPHDFEGVA
jgi:hypothetical protein